MCVGFVFSLVNSCLFEGDFTTIHSIVTWAPLHLYEKTWLEHGIRAYVLARYQLFQVICDSVKTINWGHLIKFGFHVRISTFHQIVDISASKATYSKRICSLWGNSVVACTCIVKYVVNEWQLWAFSMARERCPFRKIGIHCSINCVGFSAFSVYFPYLFFAHCFHLTPENAAKCLKKNDSPARWSFYWNRSRKPHSQCSVCIACWKWSTSDSIRAKLHKNPIYELNTSFSINFYLFVHIFISHWTCLHDSISIVTTH